MPERDDFDKIVAGLELDLDFSFPDEPADPVPPVAAATPGPGGRIRHPAETPASDDDSDTEEPFYRKVDATPVIPSRRGLLLAWLGVLGAPLALLAATVSGVYLDRSVVAGAALTFVAAAIFLILQLPEHGPSRPDWPDDGAVL